MKNLLFLCLMFCAGLSQAQKEVSAYFNVATQYMSEESVPYQYLIADEVSLRSHPKSDGKLLAVLPIGTKLKLMEQGPEMVLRNKKAAWYRVESDQGNGWIWGGFIADRVSGSNADPTVKFLMAIETTEDQEGWWRSIYEIRAYRDGKQLAKISIPCPGWNFEGFQNIGSRGVSGIDDILTLNVPCVGGCGCTTGTTYVFWNGESFVAVFDAMGTADAEYSEYETLIFPADMEGHPEFITLYSDGVNWEVTDSERFTDEDPVPHVVSRKLMVYREGKLVER
ncbi:MAG: SH3 domain-containing protein [Flavobacteriales bacterium]|nr:SH3 domain-containing protein [Flavobacteriales bacterium]